MSDEPFGDQREPAEGVVLARLNVRAQPLDRGDLYEDPLDKMLKERALGEVTGGGTQMAESGEIAFCDIEIRLAQMSEESLGEICRCLEALGAAKGSTLILDQGKRELGFGVNEGLAVYLNGTDLPDSVYEQCDINLVYGEFQKRLGSNGRVQSHWEGPRETALYLYGPSFDAMLNCIRPFLDSYPLCEKARLEKIA